MTLEFTRSTRYSKVLLWVWFGHREEHGHFLPMTAQRKQCGLGDDVGEVTCCCEIPRSSPVGHPLTLLRCFPRWWRFGLLPVVNATAPVNWHGAHKAFIFGSLELCLVSVLCMVSIVSREWNSPHRLWNGMWNRELRKHRLLPKCGSPSFHQVSEPLQSRPLLIIFTPRQFGSYFKSLPWFTYEYPWYKAFNLWEFYRTF